MNTNTLQSIPKMVSISDFQRRAKAIFADLDERQPTIVLNRNQSVGVLLKPEIYELIQEELEDLRDALYLDKLVRESKKSDFAPWEELEQELIKVGKLKPKIGNKTI